MNANVNRLNGHPTLFPQTPLADVLRRLADLAEALAAEGDVQPLALTISHAGVRLSLRAWPGAGPMPREEEPPNYIADAAAQLDFLRRTYLAPSEVDAVKAVRQHPVPGKLLARRMGRSFSSARTILGALTARGVLCTGPEGYELASPIVLQTVRDLEAEAAPV
jgi:hypothetical protein